MEKFLNDSISEEFIDDMSNEFDKEIINQEYKFLNFDFTKNIYYNNIKYQIKDDINNIINKYNHNEIAILNLIKNNNFTWKNLNNFNVKNNFILQKCNFNCIICWEYFKNKIKININCNHNVCQICFNSFILINLKENNILYLKCPSEICHKEIPLDLVIKYLDIKDIEFLKNLIYDKIIYNNKNYLKCINKNCEYYLIIEDIKFINCSLECDNCGYFTCLYCKNHGHFPLSCDEYSITTKDLFDINNIVLNKLFKKCPNCSIFYEKVDGCLHITCKNCKFQFCWICDKNWQNHSNYYECGVNKNKILLSDKKKEISNSKSWVSKIYKKNSIKIKFNERYTANIINYKISRKLYKKLILNLNSINHNFFYLKSKYKSIFSDYINFYKIILIVRYYISFSYKLLSISSESKFLIEDNLWALSLVLETFNKKNNELNLEDYIIKDGNSWIWKSEIFNEIHEMKIIYKQLINHYRKIIF